MPDCFFSPRIHVRSIMGVGKKGERDQRKHENNDQSEVPGKGPRTPLVQLSREINAYNSFNSDCSTLRDGPLMN